ncbi:MAG: D-alanyl-D-alanine carboxypeptidase [Deltaproteobacteria bacterium]|jgi:D-alanyl-D-alanine carboxypeptidase/D-alanyl-D-alanine-endopeptidase (penicillin-binding protein 4)|nr:D-alanyl-D-alanine carboxypeptidase [Deltaproteobacteria bacterium]
MAQKFLSVISRHLVLLITVVLCTGLFLSFEAPEAAWSADKKKVTAKKTKKVPSKNTVRAKNKSQASKAKPKARAKTQAVDPEKLPFPENVKLLAGSGAVLITDHHVGQNQSRELFSLNPDKTYVPASILKLVTSGAALDALGYGYRFRTDFYVDRDRNLWVVGRGDPFMVSEELCLVMDRLKKTGLSQVKDIYLDSSFFEPGIILDGNNFTINPYDAYNLAFGVNFNTVNYLIDQKGQIVECDPCSPLTPVALELAVQNRPKKRKKQRYPREFRLNISASPQQAEKNAGQMVKILLEKFLIPVSGEVILGKTLPKDVKLIYTHLSSRTLEDMIRELLKHSNNFVTNQIFLTMGAEKYGTPATTQKSQKVMADFLAKYRLPGIAMVEGSGLSRQNQITARQMARVLGTLEPVRHLINSSDDGSVIYKTGTMSDIQTLAGYLVRPDRIDEPLSFVILLNGHYRPGTRDKILNALKAQFIGEPGKQVERKVNSSVNLPRSVPPDQAGMFSPSEAAL